jgi:hypothetical protein
MNAEPAHGIRKAAYPLRELGIAAPPAIVDEGGFRAPPYRKVPLDQIGGGIVRARAQHPLVLPACGTSNRIPLYFRQEREALLHAHAAAVVDTAVEASFMNCWGRCPTEKQAPLPSKKFSHGVTQAVSIEV